MAWQLIFIDFEKLYNSKKIDISLWLVFIGIFILIVGLFLPWVSVVSEIESDFMEGFNYDLDGLDYDGKLILFLTIIVLVLFSVDLKQEGELLTPSKIISIENMPFRKKSLTRFLSFLLSLIVLLLVILNLNDAKDYASAIDQIATYNGSLGSGLFLSLVGAFLMPFAIFLQLLKEEPQLEEKKKIAKKGLKTQKRRKKSKPKEEIVKEFMGINGIGKSKAENLYEAGFRSLEELRNADIDDIAEVKGFSKVSAKRLKDNL